MSRPVSSEPIYIVTDGEFDGPIPGKHSMLSFASVAVDRSGHIFGEFEATLATLPGAITDPETDNFWKENPEAYAAATFNPEDPQKIMQRFTAWIRSLPGSAVFVSHPIALDGSWIDFYLQRFTGDCLFEGWWKENRLFRDIPFCLASMILAKYGKSPFELTPYPKEWLGNYEHTHRAIDDARGYAHLLVHLLNKA